VLPEGDYRIEAEPLAGRWVPVADFRVFDGAELETRIQGYGWLRVEALENFKVLLYYQGALFLTARCNEGIVLPVGRYKVEVDAGGFSRPSQDVRVLEARTVHWDIGGMGYLRIDAIENFPFQVKDLATGKEIAFGQCNDTFLLPVGTYKVCINPRGIGKIYCGPYAVIEGLTNRYAYGGLGYLRVQAIDDFRFDVVEVGTKRLVRHWWCNRTMVLHAGEYFLRFVAGTAIGREIGPVKVIEEKTAKPRLGGLVRLRLEGRGGEVVYLFRDEEKKPFLRAVVPFVKILPVGVYRWRIGTRGRERRVKLTEGGTVRIDATGPEKERR
jgi:hypothetical protein